MSILKLTPLSTNPPPVPKFTTLDDVTDYLKAMLLWQRTFASASQTLFSRISENIGFSATKSGTAQTINASTSTQVTFPTVVKDNLTGFSSNSYTIKETGSYFIHASSRLNGVYGAGQYGQLAILKNGVTVGVFTQQGRSAVDSALNPYFTLAAPSLSVSIYTDCVIGDVFTVYAYQTSSGADQLDGSSVVTRFFGYIV